jgi:hypothetical protein
MAILLRIMYIMLTARPTDIARPTLLLSVPRIVGTAFELVSQRDVGGGRFEKLKNSRYLFLFADRWHTRVLRPVLVDEIIESIDIARPLGAARLEVPNDLFLASP